MRVWVCACPFLVCTTILTLELTLIDSIFPFSVLRCVVTVACYAKAGADFAAEQPAVPDRQPQSAAPFVFIHSQKGKMQLKTPDGYLYVKEKQVNDKVYWRCTAYTTRSHCKSRMHTLHSDIVRQTQHNHAPTMSRNADVRPEIDPQSVAAAFEKCI